MTSAEEADAHGFLRPYAEIFSIPRAWRFSVAGVIGRLPMSMYGLGTVLLISAGTGRYGLAGTVAAVSALGNAFCATAAGTAGRPARAAPGAGADLPDLRAVGGRAGDRRAAPVPGLDAVRLRDRRRRDHAAARADGAGPLVGAAGRDVTAAHRVLDRVDRGRALLHRRARRRHPARHPGAPGGRGGHRRDLLPGGNAVVRGPARDRAPGDVRHCAAGRARRGPGRFSVASESLPGGAGAGRAGARVPVPRLDVRVGRPVDGGLRRPVRLQAAGGRDPRLLRARQRDRRALVRVAELAGAGLEAARGHPLADRGRGLHVLGDAEPAGAGDRDLPVRADDRAHPDRRRTACSSRPRCRAGRPRRCRGSAPASRSGWRSARPRSGSSSTRSGRAGGTRSRPPPASPPSSIYLSGLRRLARAEPAAPVAASAAGTAA